MESRTETPTAGQHGSRRNRALWTLLAGGVVLLVLGIAVAVAITHLDQQQSVLPASTPAGAVQRYLSFLQAGQVDRAYAMWDGPITRGEFDTQFGGWSKSSHQVVLVGSTVAGSNATVTVDISSFSGSPLGPSGNSTRVIFTLERKLKRWLITGPGYIPSM